MKINKENFTMVMINLLIIYSWIPIEISILRLINWKTCWEYSFSEYIKGDYFHYVLLIISQIIGIYYSIKNKKFFMITFIILNLYIFLYVYSKDSFTLLDQYGFNCYRALTSIN